MDKTVSQAPSDQLAKAGLSGPTSTKNNSIKISK